MNVIKFPKKKSDSVSASNASEEFNMNVIKFPKKKSDSVSNINTTVQNYRQIGQFIVTNIPGVGMFATLTNPPKVKE